MEDEVEDWLEKMRLGGALSFDDSLLEPEGERAGGEIFAHFCWPSDTWMVVVGT